MAKYNKRTVEKFEKKDNICNICQTKVKRLSEDHVPPKACPPAKNIVISKLFEQMTGNQFHRPRFSQSGIFYRTLCSNCNNMLGTKYDSALAEFCHNIRRIIESPLFLIDSFGVECNANALMRSILGHLLAAKTKTDQVVIDSLIRPCVLDSSLPIHKDIHIFYWIYPYEKTIILRDFGMPAIRGRLFEKPGFFNMLKFYPVAFLITYQLPSYENLLNLDQFNKSLLTDKVKLTIDLRPIRSSTWPEECKGLENFLLVGEASHDSIQAIPRIKIF